VTSIGELFLCNCTSLRRILVPSDGSIQNVLRNSGDQLNINLANLIL
jgi:hypothetical protein